MKRGRKLGIPFKERLLQTEQDKHAKDVVTGKKEMYPHQHQHPHTAVTMRAHMDGWADSPPAVGAGLTAAECAGAGAPVVSAAPTAAAKPPPAAVAAEGEIAAVARNTGAPASGMGVVEGQP